jgi:dihydroorotate dehydrogenase
LKLHEQKSGAKIMIKLSNGHSFEYMAASGALEFDGLGWPWEQPLRWLGKLDPSLFTTVIKTLTAEPRRGNLRMYNPHACIRLLRGGTLNAVSLTNPGIDWWCEKIGPTVTKERKLIGSILGDTKELDLMARKLNQFNLVGLEINASCPNTKSDILSNTHRVIEDCLRVREVSTFPLILKLSVTHDLETIIPIVAQAVEAFSINSVPWSVIYPNRPSPLVHLGGGGVSGWLIQGYTWPMVQKIKRLTDVPVIGPSVWEYEDLDRLRKLGADAISFGSIFLRHPWQPTSFVRRDQQARLKA